MTKAHASHQQQRQLFDPSLCFNTLIEQNSFIEDIANHLARQNASLLVAALERHIECRNDRDRPLFKLTSRLQAALKASRVEKENEINYLENELELGESECSNHPR